MFVNYNHLSRKEIHQLITKQLEVTPSKYVRIDELDCNVSCRRQPSKMTLLEFLLLIDTSEWMHCAERDNELCVNVQVNDKDYFLWIDRNTYYDKKS